jgi:heme/copper-type cytochrome/quinol oxidase subunit 2
MDTSGVLSTIIVVSFIVTVVLAMGSYMLYKLRERRKPKRAAESDPENIYFERFMPRPSAATDRASA